MTGIITGIEEARWSVSETRVEKKGNHEVKVISSWTALWVIVQTLAFSLKELGNH